MKFPKERPAGHYHCVSRVVDGQWRLEEADKEAFIKFMRMYETFSGVKVLTYCVMSNHFHILVEVPHRPETLPTHEELLERIGKSSCQPRFDAAKQWLAGEIHESQSKGREKFLETVYSQMWDVSWFIRLVKQRFVSYYNRRKGRKGTLWQERFKSVLVDGSGDALLTLGAYIDLNPVRAKIVTDPKDYRWCGYGEAMRGSRIARQGIQAAVQAMHNDRTLTVTECMEFYHSRMFGGTNKAEGSAEENRSSKADVGEAEGFKKPRKSKSRMPMSDYLRRRVRYFTDGAIVGSQDFVDEMFTSMRSRFGPNRKTGARRMKGVEEPIFALRQLQKDVIQPSNQKGP